MRDSSEILKAAIADGTKVLQSLAGLEPRIAQASDLIVNCLTSGKKVLACGNGGSAADAADFCTEFACRFVEDRRPYPAMNLSQGGSLITAIGNDYGFEEIFARQVRAFGDSGDVLIAISTSGKSKNIRRAIEEARNCKLKTIALLGRDGGSCAGLADVDLIVKDDSTGRIQEAHKFILHVICEICEGRLPRK
ncbi:MAG TPA: SIS domain-containing protein [Chthoniobacterales bacterium]|jgi:phosphoheptose isomerase|nr:SIS domain-containing protein [Chthoniobacterales bacterium]